ncbi:hypothetical protein BDZ88DRAFT_235589 [Geranomyces variabilis]|nr:hypothetical protein BDZ88DRAFT_235589 [Geranomyces variabilis]
MTVFTPLIVLPRRTHDETAASDATVSNLGTMPTSPSSFDSSSSSFFVHDSPYEHYDNVKTERIAVTALLFLWLATLLAKQIAVFVEMKAQRREEEVPVTEYEPLLGGRQRSKAAEWAPRFDKAADAVRGTLLMLLAAAMFVSIPVPYTCQLQQPPCPGTPIPPETQCTVCFANGTTLGTSIISWVFTALSLLWLAMELAVVDKVSTAIARILVSLASFPLILTIFGNEKNEKSLAYLAVIGFKEWAKIEARADETCN